MMLAMPMMKGTVGYIIYKMSTILVTFMLYGVINILIFNLFIRLIRLSDNWNQLADIFNNEEPQRVAIAMVDCATEVELCTGTLYRCRIYGCRHFFIFLSRGILFS